MDPSWIWDVPFELLAGRTVVASGDRRLDLRVRLDVAGVEHTVAPDAVAAARTCRSAPSTWWPPTPRSTTCWRRSVSAGDSALRIAHLYPTVLGLYGDRGNALVLAHRAGTTRHRRRDRRDRPGEAVPRSCDVYHLGGGEDLAQTTAAELLVADGGARRRRGRRRHRAGHLRRLPDPGHQLRRRRPPGGRPRPARPGHHAPQPTGPWASWWPRRSTPRLGLLTGFENHGGGTTLGPGRRAAGAGAPRPGQRRATTAPKACATAASSAPTCTAPRWPATRPWPTWCSAGPSAPRRRRSLDDTTVEALRAERLAAVGLR